MKFLSLFAIALGWLNISYAQLGTASSGARSLAMGNTPVLEGPYSSFSNQAGLASTKETTLFLSAENRFLLSELQIYTAGVVIPSQYGAFGFNVSSFGYKGYNDQKIGLNYSRKLFNWLNLGGQLDFLSLRIPDYGHYNLLTFELGLLAKLSKKVKLGTHLYNPIGIKLSNEDRIPVIIKTAIKYQSSKRLILVVGVRKHIDFPIRLQTGLEFKIAPTILMRVGFQSAPTQINFGIGVRLKNIRLDISSGYHQLLGLSPSISVSYHFHKSN